MTELFATLATPLYAITDFVLDAPAAAIAVVSGIGIAVALAVLLA